MKLSDVARRLPDWYEAGISIHLEGPPGRGKTSVIEGAPEVLASIYPGSNFGLRVLNGGCLTVADVMGYGVPQRFTDENGQERTAMVFTEAFFAVGDEGDHWSGYDGGILFIDEADKMDVETKKIMGEARLSGRFGPHRLPKGWVVWTAGNNEKHRSGSTKKLDHEINRTMWLNVDDDPEGWKSWALSSNVDPVTVAFAMQFQHVVWVDSVPEKQGPWCTPRSLCMWDKYAGLRKRKDGGRISDDALTIEEAAGLIGVAAAQQYFTFLRLETELPVYEDIIASPETCLVPSKPDQQMLLCYNMAFKAVTKDADKLMKYFSRFPSEFAVTFCHAASKKNAAIVNTKAFVQWAMKNASLMATVNSAR